MSPDDMLDFAREALGLSKSATVKLLPLQGRGSDRTYYRLRWNEADSAILVHYDPKRIENKYYADIAEFLYDARIPVPRLIRHDPGRCSIAMEDLGDKDLWSFRRAGWETRQILYRKTLAAIHTLHSFPEKDFPINRVRLMESFGPDLYRWERDYFRDHFVKDVCRISLEPSFERELEAELSALAERLSGTKRSLVHRDLQSQNVMILGGEIYLIDFQGMRFGTLFYDLGSLLCDPYVEFSDVERNELLSYYYGLSNQDLDWATFRNCFWEASAQRLMQALGAYGFLGLNKGLEPFLEHIPSGLRKLKLATTHVASLARLRELCQECEGAIERFFAR